MQIQLKQREIEEALKSFISHQGISLVGKSIQIEFTSGRKDNGLSAEMTIEDAASDKQQAAPTEPTTEEVAAKPAVSLFSK